MRWSINIECVGGPRQWAVTADTFEEACMRAVSHNNAVFGERARAISGWWYDLDAPKAERSGPVQWVR